MALEPVGVQFVSIGFEEFIRNLGEAAKAIATMGRMTENRLQALRELGSLMKIASDGASEFAKSVGNSEKDVASSSNKMLGSLLLITASFKKFGSDVGGTFKGIGNAFKNIPKFMNIFGLIGSAIGGIAGIAGGPAGIAAGLGIGNLAGQITGALVAFSIDVGKATRDIFLSITKTILMFLPKTIAKIVNAGISIGKALWNLGKNIINIAKTILSPITNAIKSIFSTILGLFTATGKGGGWRSLGGTIFSSMFKFEVLKQIIRGVVNELKDLASAAFLGAVELQTLTVRLDNLIAMQIRNAEITKDYGKSIQMATGYTKSLLKWIQELALATPISVEDISNITYLSLAMGWSVTGAKKLTKAVVDYTAALGMGSEISERIIYNFAQMKQQGKVTGTELRDLGRGAFMPINDILRIMYDNLVKTNDATKKVTMSFEQFRDEASAGKQPVEEFFKAFEDFVALNMPDMAYKMNYTFQAVRQNISDLFKILLGWNVLGPMIASITKPFQNFINNFKSPIVLEKANAIGKAIAYMVNSIQTGFSLISKSLTKVFGAMGLASPSIESVVKTLIKLGMTFELVGYKISQFIDRYILPFATTIGDKFGKTFKGMRDDFFGWGVGLIVSFAEGMVAGAAKALTYAINFIVKLLTSWMSTSSPPKMLPNIGRWGMDTINEWLHGFTQADFDVLDDLQNIVKDTLGAMVNLGLMTDVDASKMFADLSVELIRGFDEFNRTGTISTGIFEKLRNIGGVYGQEVAELLDLQLQHVVALERATQAQKDYDAAVKASIRSETKVNNLIRQYNSTLRKGASKATLKDKLKIVNVAQMELNANRKAEISKKTALDLAQEQLKIIEEQVKLQESLIKQMIELAQAQKEAAGGAADVASEIEGILSSFEDAFGKIDTSGWKLNFTELWKDAKDEFDKTMGSISDSWNRTWKDAFGEGSEFQKAWSKLQPFIQPFIDKAKAAWDKFASEIGLPSIQEIFDAWTNVPDITTYVPNIPSGKEPGMAPTAEQIAQPGLKAVTTTDWIGKIQAVLAKFSEAIKTNGGIKATIGEIANYLWQNLSNWISTKWEEYKPIVTQKLADAIRSLADSIRGGGKGSKKGKTGGGNVLGDALVDLGRAIAERIWSAFADKLRELFTFENIISTAFSGTKLLLGSTPAGQLLNLGEMFYSAVSDAADSVEEPDWSSLLPAKPVGTDDFFGRYKTMGVDMSTGLFSGVDSVLEEKDDGKVYWERIKESAITIFETRSESKLFKRFGVDIINGLKSGIVTTLNNLFGPQGALSVAFRNFIANFKRLFGIGLKLENNPFFQIGKAIIDGIVAGINAYKSILYSLMQELATVIVSVLRTSTQSTSPSKVFYDIGEDIILGLSEGIEDTSYRVGENLRNSLRIGELKRYDSMNAPMNASPIYGGTTVNFGDVHISGSMDWAMFKAQVQKAITER